MKTVQIIGENLHENLLVAITSKTKTSKLSLAINIKFIEKEEIQEARLVIHTVEFLYQENIISFTGTVFTKENARPCMVCHCTNNSIQECWMTIIEPKTETFTTNISKTEFIKKCKEYCINAGLEINQDGNLMEGFSIFRNSPKPGDPGGILMNGKETIMVNTEMYNNLFPIEKDNNVIFGEYIDEHIVRTCSIEEARLRGVTIS
ncbi:MAG: hypothetical protein ACD_80C00025G0003 [uncultured bacterium (gcode 4)]|uniref:Uncharacterized protein n=1 Tax=uncultured bacterium (gcode 4) TaxID=1234023 RepID=K1YJN0_9BACT|nr:MAG: hypothetical protein ACD_80C00025G0003 [uncultured bacterium (gcode 4)]